MSTLPVYRTTDECHRLAQAALSHLPDWPPTLEDAMNNVMARSVIRLLTMGMQARAWHHRALIKRSGPLVPASEAMHRPWHPIPRHPVAAGGKLAAAGRDD